MHTSVWSIAWHESWFWIFLASFTVLVALAMHVTYDGVDNRRLPAKGFLHFFTDPNTLALAQKRPFRVMSFLGYLLPYAFVLRNATEHQAKQTQQP